MQKLAWVLGTLTALLLVAAGAGKLLDWPAYAESVDQWTLLPAFARWAAAYVLPPVELVGGVLWFRPATRSLARAVHISVLGLVVGVVAAHLLRNVRPDCNCYGKVMEWLGRGERFRAEIWPSALLLACAVASWGLGHERPRLAKPQRCATLAGNGFTLVEVLVCVALLGVLITLTGPALLSARRSARATLLITNLRSAAQVAAAYATDWHDQLPFYFADRGAGRGVTWSCAVQSQSLGLIEELPNPFAGGALWHVGLADYAFNGRPSPAAVNDPRSPADDPRPLLYACSLMTHPSYWDVTLREGANQFRPALLSVAANASKKSVFVTEYPYHYTPEGTRRGLILPRLTLTEMAFLDGHAAAVPGDEILPGVISGDGSAVPGWGTHCPDRLAGLHAEHGVRGKDIR